jgi:tetratricopeptide (TPR) repeat protein
MKRFPTIAILLAVWMAAGCASDPNIEGAKLDLRNQDYVRALENVDEALARDPENSEAYDLKGQILQAQAADVTDPEEHAAIVEEMLAAYERAAELDPELEDAVTQRLGLAYYNEFRSGIQAYNRAADDPEEFNTAASYFELASRLQPDSAGAYVNQAFALLNAGRQDEAVEPLETAIEMGDEQKNTFLFLGDIYARRDETERALEIYQQAAEIFPDDPDVQSQLLNAYVQTGQEDQAMQEYRSAVENNPNDPLLLYNLGSLLLEAEMYDEAVEYLERSVQNDPEYANAQYNLGAAYVNQAVEVNEEVSTLDDALREERGQLSDSEIAQREAAIEERAAQRRDLFAQAIPPLEKAMTLMESAGDDATGVCQALFSAYVQTEQEAKAQAVSECAGYDDVETE